MIRLASIGAVVCALTFVARADGAETHMGKIISAGGGRIVLQMEAERKATYEVASDAMIMLDNQPAALERLSLGDTATLTLDNRNSRLVVTMCDAKSAMDKLRLIAGRR